MMPLSALKIPVTPDLRSVMAQGSDLLQGAGAGKSIPSAELAKLAAGAVPQSTSVSGVEGNSFASTLGQMVNEVNGKQIAAGDAVNGLLGGGNVSLHQAMIAMEEANVSLQLMIQVRNKLLESYQELMRMQV